MNAADRRLLSSNEWGPTNGTAVDLFHDIVEHHFYEHLEMAGIKHMACRLIGTDIRGQQQYDFVQLCGPGQIRDEFIGVSVSKSGCIFFFSLNIQMSQYKFEWKKPGNHKPAFHRLHISS